MADESAYEHLMRQMADFSSAHIDPLVKAKQSDADRSRAVDENFSAVFFGFTEIIDTLDALEMCEKLVGVAPPRSKHVESDKYLKFLVGAYLQEMYILEQRMTAYAR